MKALVYLLGARALDIAHDHQPQRRTVRESSLPPIASTPETAGAWRRWAEAGRSEAARAGWSKPVPSGLPIPGQEPAGA